MCNIAGYIGSREAAPVLIEMMKRQEGFWGGYYTGITTHFGGELHSVKVVGDTENLLNETDAVSLPGKTGFIHSRSNSGGDVAWGHPFTTADGSMSYIANGIIGIKMDNVPQPDLNKLASELECKGYIFKTKTPGVVGEYPRLSDNTAIHGSELMCYYIDSLIKGGLTPDAALSRAYTDLPSQQVGLVMHKSYPDSIFVSRTNFPMMIGVAEDGDVYLATTALAFPDDVKFRTIELLTHLSTFEVKKGMYIRSPYQIGLDMVNAITPGLWHEGYVLLEKLLSGTEPVYMWDAVAECEKLWNDGEIPQSTPFFYEIIRQFKKEGRLRVVPTPAKGAFEGYTTNNFRVCIE